MPSSATASLRTPVSDRPRRIGKLTALLVTMILLTGCPRVLHLDYRPSTSLKGSGPVRVDSFSYAGHPTGLMKQKELQTGAKDPEALYLSEDISDFFAGALRSELTLAGYELRRDSTRTVSGTIEQFFLDYVGKDEQRFRARVVFTIARNDLPPLTVTCLTDRQQVRDWMRSGLLIEQGIHACIEEFIKNAQAAGAL